MEFLQPSTAPIVAFVAGWWYSKGHGFQTLATDAVTTMIGVLMVLGFTTMRILAVAFMTSGEMSTLVPVGLLCAVGPWVVVYLLFGLIVLPMQLCFILGMIEIWLCKSGHLFGYAMFFLGILVVVLTFVAFTPIWALWELGWATRQKIRMYKGVLVKDEKGEEPLFPLARYFRNSVPEYVALQARLRQGLVLAVHPHEHDELRRQVDVYGQRPQLCRRRVLSKRIQGGDVCGLGVQGRHSRGGCGIAVLWIDSVESRYRIVIVIVSVGKVSSVLSRLGLGMNCASPVLIAPYLGLSGLIGGYQLPELLSLFQSWAATILESRQQQHKECIHPLHTRLALRSWLILSD